MIDTPIHPLRKFSDFIREHRVRLTEQWMKTVFGDVDLVGADKLTTSSSPITCRKFSTGCAPHSTSKISKVSSPRSSETREATGWSGGAKAIGSRSSCANSIYFIERSRTHWKNLPTRTARSLAAMKVGRGALSPKHSAR
ncbi:Signal transduction histidine kinase [Caballeronia sordidicola]|uniref:Signal transduction histidine kinase n=1 Tax=Caballeronia sordidicola TaxID=196367 RepID=A0A242MLG3_CABSO|nr:Signal transduction histidine kinase [Caballeronia sordidicola]